MRQWRGDIASTTGLAMTMLLAVGCAAATDSEEVAQSESAASSGTRSDTDAAGTLASYSTNNFSTGATKGFFANLGTNGRTCGTCHRQDEAWTFTPAHASTLASNDPLFSPNDGSDCPPTSTTQGPDKSRSTLVTGYGLIRVQIAVPGAADYTLADASNPMHCNVPPGSATIGGQLFLFRRPLPSTNLQFLSTVMWDGRETLQKLTQTTSFGGSAPLAFDLADQANGATLGHAQATQSIAGTQTQTDIVSFERNLYTAQGTIGSLKLTANNGKGGPAYIAQTVAPAFFIGQNDTFGGSFDPTVFTIYAAWEPNANGQCPPQLSAAQCAIGRGERLFNTRTFTIANVAGINSASTSPIYNPADPLANTPISGTCGTCHNTPNVGNHSTALPINIGVSDSPTRDNGGHIISVLDRSKLPVYSFKKGSAEFQTSDPGRALISGNWVDLGKTKGPILRGLAGRAPYFHNGSARDLATVVTFYDARFNIGLSAAEQSDLVAFLNAL